MKESKRQKIEAAARPYLEPGESLKSAVAAVEGSRIFLYMGLFGYFMLNHFIVAVTDRNVYILKAAGAITLKASGVDAKHPLGTVEVTAGSGFPVGPLSVGGRKLWVAKILQKTAAELATAATSR